MEELKEDGWSLNADAVLELGDDKTNFKSAKDVLKLVLDQDLHDIGAPLLDSKLDRQARKFQGPAVLQVSKIRNVLSTKVHEYNRLGGERLLRLLLTDGHNTVSAIEQDTISKISMNTPPGTKIALIGTIELEQGFLLLSDKNTRILGGRVQKLVEKWEVNKDSQMMMHMRANKGLEGPPPWVPFGKRINKPHSTAQHVNPQFKAMDVVNALTKGESEPKDSSEFEAARLASIAELKSQAMQGTKKFASVQPQILNKPKPPMPPRENVPSERKPFHSEEQRSDRPERGRGGGRRGRGRFDDDDVVDPDAPRPSGPSTLFDYLVPKVPQVAQAPQYFTPPPPLPPPSVGRQQNQHQRSRGDGRRGGGRGAPAGGGFRDRNSYQDRDRNSYQDRDRNSYQDRDRNSYQDRDRNANHQSKYRQQQPPPPPPTAAAFRDDFPSIESSVDALRNKMRIGPGPVWTPSPSRFQQPRSFGSQNKSAQSSASRSDVTSDASGSPQWKPGQKCLAPFTDGRFYMATVQSLGPADMCTVRYDDYGNTSSVPQGVMVMPQFSGINWGL
uniref:Tudor domain-containing protein n=1 Tax=Plectus sambesii TaxID=2011161 RepID=A0A914X6E9_9BILA